MTVIANLDINVRALTDKFKKKLKEAANSVKQFATKVASLAKMGALALGAVAIAGLTFGVKLAAQAETAQVAFSTMLGDAGKAKDLLGEIAKFAAATPFAQADLRDSAQKLLAFGISADDVMDRLKLLGDISAGSGARISELTAIFGKVSATGKVGLETINQIAERGIPIYDVLKKQYGATGEELSKMISAGKIGFPDLQKALETMTAAGGIFSGAMIKQSGTIAGLWSTFKDNVGLVLQEVAAFFMETFDFKGILASVTTGVQGILGWFRKIMPILVAVKGVWIASFTPMMDLLSLLWELVVDAFTGIGEMLGISGATFEDWRDTIIIVLGTMEFAYLNWQELFLLGLDTMKFGIVKYANDVVHFFGVVIPKTWREFLQVTLTVFNNVNKNLVNFVKAVVGFFKSGFRKFKFAWTPLTEGAEDSIAKIKEAMKRAPTDFEKELFKGIKARGGKLKTGLDSFLKDKMSQFDKVGEDAKKKIEKSKPIKAKIKADVKADVKAKVSTEGAAAIGKGTAAAFSAIAKARRASASDPTIKKLEEQRKLQEEANKSLATIAASVGTSGLALAGL